MEKGAGWETSSVDADEINQTANQWTWSACMRDPAATPADGPETRDSELCHKLWFGPKYPLLRPFLLPLGAKQWRIARAVASNYRYSVRDRKHWTVEHAHFFQIPALAHQPSRQGKTNANSDSKRERTRKKAKPTE